MICRNFNPILSAGQRKPWHRIVSFLLALVLFVGNFPFSAGSAEIGEEHGTESGADSSNSGELSYDYDTLKIARDGELISALKLQSHEKIEIHAQGLTESASYQWQVQHPEQDDLWVNIYDGTNQTISVTLALVENVLREDGTAKLRCRAYTESYAYLSNTVTVALESEKVMAVSEYQLLAAEAVMPLAEDGVTPEFVSVTIEYIRFDNVLQADGTFREEETGPAFTSYVAMLQYNSSLTNQRVHCPSIVGYQPVLKQITKGADAIEPNEDDFDEENATVIINQSNITGDIVYRVEYHPDQVKYEVRYFFQNIYDDLYVEDTSVIGNAGIASYPVIAYGNTGTHPDEVHTKMAFTGFTSLYYEPETIAADGSTVFHVYYERNYYLMEFDCNEGYGTDTVYVRHGTYISVPNPVRSGYVFNGWDLIATGDLDKAGALGDDVDNDGRPDGDGNKNDLPGKMPPYNSAYKALWEQAETTYTVAYWVLDSEGNKTYIGGRTESANSGDEVSGEHDLGTQEKGGKPKCDLLEHTHTVDCFNCGQEEHTHHVHSIACYSYITSIESTPVDNNSDLNAMWAANGSETPGDGTLYFIYTDSNGNLWPKLYINGNYYTIQINNSNTVPEALLDEITEGEQISLGTSSDYHARKYNAKKDCGMNACADGETCSILEHTHDAHCTVCEFDEHAHTGRCYKDTRNLVEIESYTFTNDAGEVVTISTDKRIIVEGDGSTVVNVYYQYREYTLKFYYAATTGGTDSDDDGVIDTYDSIKIVGGSTYYFGYHKGTDTTDDTVQLEKMFNLTQSECGSIQSFPSLNAKGESRGYTKGTLPVDRDNDGAVDITYHYISFKARYNDNISDMWPCGVFNSATRTDKTSVNGWSGTEAFVSAWNGEHHVKYSRNTNETIKGVYEKLDDNLLFHSDYTDESEVSYLCFWENGANIQWSIPELYRYNIWLEGDAPNNEPTVTKDDVSFYLADFYDTCDNSSVGEQTQPGLTGYTPCYFTHDYDKDFNKVKDSDSAIYFEYTALVKAENTDQLSQDGYFDGSLYSEGYVVDFYYLASQHTLKFMNHNEWLTDGTGVPLKYGVSLQKYGAYVNDSFMAQPENFPETLEPGAYEFGGWYTTANCLPGTEMDWDSTMPDSDLTVYAYWKPVTHNVYFYYDYSDYLASQTADDPTVYYWYHEVNGVKVPASYPIPVTHGDLLGTAYSYTPKAQEGYTFVGWFYIDETGKKRFAPDTMEVKKDLHLFAEWQSGIDTTYEVQYVLSGTGESVAEPTAGHLTAGKTKTFTAKVGAELLPAFQDQSLFPRVNSHSILMEQESEYNRYTFEYVEDETVWYRVRYVDKITGLDLHDEKIESTGNAIVTEKFVPVTGYIPDNYYIRKVLAADGDSTVPIELNEIIFYYTPDTEHGLYVVEYYTQNLDETWHLEQSELGSDDLGATISVTIDSDKFNGFTYSYATVTTYDEDGNATERNCKDAAVSGEVTQNGLEIKIYYTRNSYYYYVRYVEYGTGKVLDRKAEQGIFGNTVGHIALDQYESGDTKYLFYPTAEKPKEQTMTIRASNTDNVMTFYYQAKTVLIFYKAVCLIPGAIDYGVVSLNFESAANIEGLSGSEAMAGSGFRFVGWYADESCQGDPISRESTYRPTQLPDEDTVTYYALFEPIYTKMTIKNEVNGAPDGEDCDTFLFHIQGLGKTAYIDLIVSINGSGTLVLEQLPVGDYDVTELTDWSWKYIRKDVSTAITVDYPNYTFTNSYVGSDWLGSEGNNENVFN